MNVKRVPTQSTLMYESKCYMKKMENLKFLRDFPDTYTVVKKREQLYSWNEICNSVENCTAHLLVALILGIG